MRRKHDWLRETYKKSLEKIPERPVAHRTLSNIAPDPLYTPEDIGVLDPEYEEKRGFPGEFPYTRGVYGSMYRSKLWTMRMFAGFGTAEQTNERFKKLLKAGQTGLSVAFDLPTLMGYDSDHPLAKGEVGKCGVAVSSLADMEILFEGINLEEVTTSMTINSPANAIWAMYLAVAKKKGYDWKKLGGTIQNDILKEFIAQKEFIFPPEPSVKLVIDTFEWGPKNVPKWNFISVSGYHIREAGSTAVQELAWTLADGFEYVEAALKRGLDIDEFAPRISFFFDVHNDFFEEIAKFRAARRIWAKEMRYRYKAKNPQSWMLRTHAQTAGVSLTAQQPLNNIARVAIPGPWRRSSAAQTASTPTPTTRPWPCPRRRAPPSPSAPSRSSPTRPGSPTPLTPWRGATTWSGSPTRWSGRPWRSLRRSAAWGAWCGPLRRGTSSGSSPRPATATSRRWSGRSGSSWG